MRLDAKSRAMRLALGVILVLCADRVFAGQPGQREQWQPEAVETDRRLGERVNIEILARSAAVALRMISQETGVDLGVSPDQLGTIGERKLTVIAQGCSLKGIMAQIPRALQDCHWEVDSSGPQPVYTLHWDSRAQDSAWQRHRGDTRARSRAGGRTAPAPYADGEPSAAVNDPVLSSGVPLLLTGREFTTLPLGEGQPLLHPIQIQLAIARATGLSVVSDYFAGVSVGIPGEMRQTAALSRLLEVMRDGRVDWTKEGDILVFHQRTWFYFVAEEVPEQLLLPYVGRLGEAEAIPADDLVSLALAVGDRPFSRASGDAEYRAMRRRQAVFHVSALALLTSLPKEQAARVLGKGLPLREMAPAQRTEIERLAKLLEPPPALTDDVTFVVEIGVTGPAPSGWTYVHVQPYLGVSGEMEGTQAHFILPSPDAYPVARR